MKKSAIFLFLIAIPFCTISQPSDFNYSLNASSFAETPLPARDDTGYPISRFSLSINPLGFLQFGPSVNAEIGLTANLVLNLHARFPTLGLLTYVVNDDSDGLDDLKAFAFGGGPIFFFGENQSKPYLGVFFDFDKYEKLYAENESWEWTSSSKVYVFMVNGGYRFRFDSGFFINTGAFLGVAIDNNTWQYTAPGGYGSDNGSPHDSTEPHPFGMAEVTLGIEF